METVLGIDVGTSSTKGVLTTLTGEVLASGVREHQVARPRTGFGKALEGAIGGIQHHHQQQKDTSVKSTQYDPIV